MLRNIQYRGQCSRYASSLPGPVHNTTDARFHIKDGAVVWRPTSGDPKTSPKGPNVMSEGEQGTVEQGQSQYLLEHTVPARVVANVQQRDLNKRGQA